MKRKRRSHFPNAIGSPVFVLDCSVAYCWATWVRYDQYALHVAGRMTQTAVVVPRAWPQEIAERILNGERTETTTQTQVDTYFTQVGGFRIFLDTGSPMRGWQDVVSLARTHGLTVSEAGYLELALRTRLPLATIDATLLSVAGTLKVPIFVP